MSMLRKFKRNILKNELGTNKINDEYHRRYGYKPNITKQELKLVERAKRRFRKLMWKILRSKRKVNDEK